MEKILEDTRWGEEGRGCEMRGQRREEEREKQENGGAPRTHLT